ncbi:hypothetical protein BIW11_04781 [Tropilaelaps mercedesae]|uniref:Uncharacterized protein n=1 Tax=Tropilaelaps mercedesae TaxID=418985 RepID=A0A1V9X1T6_9ACAR|nr:hypothetical protein BIW11_04781 [Tropilaelaps mercedesae]
MGGNADGNSSLARRNQQWQTRFANSSQRL